MVSPGLYEEDGADSFNVGISSAKGAACSPLNTCELRE